MAINGKTQLVGIIGDPVSHSASPAMHNAAYQHLGLNYAYIPLAVKSEHLAEALRSVRIFGLSGLNVTVPHKENVIPFLDELAPSAKKAGAVNTIVNYDGKLVGYNTDGEGFVHALQADAHFQCAGKRVAILGAGGSAKAIAFALLEQKIDYLAVLNRSADRSENLLRQLRHESHTPMSSLPLGDEKAAERLGSCDLVVNTTPLGMSPKYNAMPIEDFAWVKTGQTVCDIIYNPAETKFLEHCRKAGAKTFNGVGMLAGQGSLAFQLFTGKSIPYEFLKREVISAVC